MGADTESSRKEESLCVEEWESSGGVCPALPVLASRETFPENTGPPPPGQRLPGTHCSAALGQQRPRRAWPDSRLQLRVR